MVALDSIFARNVQHQHEQGYGLRYGGTIAIEISVSSLAKTVSLKC